MDGRANNGMAIDDLAHTAHNVVVACLGKPMEWDSADRSAWEMGASRAVKLVEGAVEDGIELSAVALAQAILGAFRGRSVAKDEWEATDLHQRLAWEAAGRHLVNLIDSDGSPKMAEHETKWPGWVARKLDQEGVLT